MLWALASSAFVIYLYRKLSAEDAEGTGNSTGPLGEQTPMEADWAGLSQQLKTELARLNQRISALEGQLSKYES